MNDEFSLKGNAPYMRAKFRKVTKKNFLACEHKVIYKS